MSSESATGAERFAAVDYVKALAIFAVVVTHAGYPISRGAISTAENLIRHSWVSFHVPAFLVMAGFLYYRAGPIDPREAGRRLVRVLIPYAIASLALYGIGVAHFQDWERLVFALATGNAVGEYYFVFVLSICIPWIVLLSRAPAGLLWAALGCLAAYTTFVTWFPLAKLTQNWFWAMREPLSNFYWGYFLVGWVSARHCVRLAELSQRWRFALSLAFAIVIALWLYTQIGLILASQRPQSSQLAWRVLYSLCVVGLVALWSAGRRVPQPVRFASEATLAIYLYHRAFQTALLDFTQGWHAVDRIPLLVAGGFAGTAVVLWIGHRLLGVRSRVWLGG